MSAEPEGRHALVVAISQYADPKLQQLRAPATDAERLAAVLRDPGKGNFDVGVLLNSTHAEVTRGIASFFRDRRQTDLLLLHFSCHGVKDDRAELFLAAADTEIDLLSATGVSASWLNDQISRTRSRRTVVLLDCCFSGSFPFGMKARGRGVDAPEQLQGRGRAIITASSAMEYAYEGDHLTGEGQPSIFTAAVVDGLETGRADLDQDQVVSVDDLYNYVYDRVKDATPSQTPSKKSDLEGPLYLAKSSYRPEVEPAQLDPDLIARTEDRYAGIREGAVQELAQLLSSRDPAVALAARRLLEKLTADDSRRVSESAHAALAESEPEPEPEVPPADAPPPSPAAPSWPRRHARVVISVVAIVVALAVVVVAFVLPSQPEDEDDGGGQAIESAKIPTANPCNPATRDSWMVAEQGAQEQYECELETSPPPNGLRGGSLVYGLFPTAAKARAAFDEGLQFEYVDEGATPCPQDTLRQVRDAFAGGAADCLVGDEYLAIWWNENGSRVLGVLDFTLDTKPLNAAEAWKRIIAAN